ncbi:MAG TPA: Crp/Fnr family transcriptional regulator [Pseudolabrys sp.]|jgi:CRP/FNR family transcriptional regulator|nr:Crp/Fnr family transcriptional regulator [Pseudolabrys sp.]
MSVGTGRGNGHGTPCEACPLRKRESLREFTADELAFVKEFKADELRVEAGVSFLREGARSDQLYTVLNGWAFRYKMLDDGRRQILNYALPADMVGLQGALMREMEHSVEALTPLTLCVFPRAKMWDLYSRIPTLAFDITWLAAREEQLIDQHLLSVGRRSALERTAYLLLHLYVRAQEAALVKDSTIQFPFTQQHLADTLGMSLVHTNKTLKRLMQSNAVRWKDRVFEMVDRAALVEIAGEDVRTRRPRPFI